MLAKVPPFQDLASLKAHLSAPNDRGFVRWLSLFWGTMGIRYRE